MPQKNLKIKKVLCFDWSHWKMWRGVHTRLNGRACKKSKSYTKLNGWMQRKPKSYSCNAQKGS